MITQIPSLSRLLDTKLNVEVVEGEVTNIDSLLSLTISIATEDYFQLSGKEIENLYLRKMVDAIADKINCLGNVKTRAIPVPKNEVAWLCTKGRIPVLLRVVRRLNPDRYQILMHVLVQPE